MKIDALSDSERIDMTNFTDDVQTSGKFITGTNAMPTKQGEIIFYPGTFGVFGMDAYTSIINDGILKI
jgi:hypothetical protein